MSDLGPNESVPAAALEEHAAPVVVLDSRGTIVYHSPGIDLLLGHGPGALTRARMTDLAHPDDRDMIGCLFHDVHLQPGTCAAGTLRVRCGDGSYRTFDATLLNRRHDAAVRGVVVRLRDASRPPSRLRPPAGAEPHVPAVVDRLRDGVVVLDGSGAISYVSAAVPATLDYTSGELLGRRAAEFLHPVDRAVVDRLPPWRLGRLLCRARTTFRARHKNGAWIDVEAASTDCLDDPHVRGIVLSCRNVTGRQETLHALRRAERRFKRLFDQAGDAIIVHDRAGRVLDVNQRLCASLGYTRAELLQFELADIDVTTRRGEVSPLWLELQRGGSVTIQGRHRRRDGTTFPVEVVLGIFETEGEELILALCRDTTDRDAALAALRSSELNLATAQRIAGLGSWERDFVAGTGFWSPELLRMFEFPADREAPTFAEFRDRVQPEDREGVIAGSKAGVVNATPYHRDYRLHLPSGHQRIVREHVEFLKDEAGAVVKQIGTVLDITKQKALEDEVVYQSFHDPLTGLPNRALFNDRVGHALARAARHGRSLAVLLLDIDRFKLVNDSLGSALGDQLLVAFSGRLAGLLRSEDTVARLAGDEFALLIEELEGIDEVPRIATRAGEVLRAPFSLGNHDIFITTSTGIALGEAGWVQPPDLLRDAGVALVRAKAKGGNQCELFNRGMADRALERLELDTALRKALERDELEVHFQPLVDLATSGIIGTEALARWRHPTKGLLAAGAFIPHAEATGLILPIGRHVLAVACRQTAAYNALHPDRQGLRASVNLSARQFQQPDLVADVAKILEETRLPASHLTLEITESVALQEPEAAIVSLRALKALGVRLALDDFGTGYSSFSYLQLMPIDVIKIDRSFLNANLGRGRDLDIVRAIALLARALGMEVVLEGIETPAQLDLARKARCDVGQGYYFSRPVPVHEFETLLAAESLAPKSNVLGRAWIKGSPNNYHFDPDAGGPRRYLDRIKKAIARRD